MVLYKEPQRTTKIIVLYIKCSLSTATVATVATTAITNQCLVSIADGREPGPGSGTTGTAAGGAAVGWTSPDSVPAVDTAATSEAPAADSR